MKRDEKVTPEVVESNEELVAEQPVEEAVEGAKKPVRLTQAEAEMVVRAIESVFPASLGVHPDELTVASVVFEIASGLCRKAADVHSGLQVPWASMCYIAKTSPGLQEMLVVQDVLERMLAPLHVDIIKQIRPRRGAALPNFVVATA